MPWSDWDSWPPLQKHIMRVIGVQLLSLTSFIMLYTRMPGHLVLLQAFRYLMQDLFREGVKTRKSGQALKNGKITPNMATCRENFTFT